MPVTVIIAVTRLICGVITAVTSTADAVMPGLTFWIRGGLPRKVYN